MDLFRLETVGNLEDASAFRECRGVLAIVPSLADHPRWAHGVALDLLKQAACADVLSDLYAAGHAEEVRVARIHPIPIFFEGKASRRLPARHLGSARPLACEPHIRRRGVRLVAQRLLTLAEHEDSLTESEGLRLAIALASSVDNVERSASLTDCSYCGHAATAVQCCHPTEAPLPRTRQVQPCR